MGGSTTVEAPPPAVKTEEEVEAQKLQNEQLRQLIGIQQAQFEQFQQFAPAQLRAFETQEKLAREATEQARALAPTREDLERQAALSRQSTEAQTQLLQFSTEEAQRRASLDRLTLPILLEQAGQRPVFDNAGNIVALERIPEAEKTELERVQEQFALESSQEALKGLRGEVPVGSAFDARIEDDRRALRENLRRQLGPGFETSTPGIEALAEFEQRANEARENIRFGRLTQTAALSDISSERLNQALLRDIEILNRERASNLPGAFSVAGAAGGRSSDALARAFALSQNVTIPGSQALSASAQTGALTTGFAGDITGQFATDRRLQDQRNFNAAIQSAANRAQRSSDIFGLGGSLIGAGGAIGSAYLLAPAFAARSSRAIKENGVPVDPEEVLDAMRDLAVEEWNYKAGIDPSTERHIGPYAEDFREKFGVGDGVTINMLDAIGVLFAAVKALEARTADSRREANAPGIS